MKKIIAFGVVIAVLISLFLIGRTYDKIQVDETNTEEEVVTYYPPTEEEISDVNKYIKEFTTKSENFDDKKNKFSTAALIIGFSEEDGIRYVSLDYLTQVNAYEEAVLKIIKGWCNLPDMSKAQALDYAKERLEKPYNDKWVYTDIGLFTNNCIDGYISVDFGGTVDQDSKIHKLPISQVFQLLNTCYGEPTLDSIKETVTYGGEFKYDFFYPQGGVYIRKVNIENGEVVNFDFVNGCAS